MASIVSSGIGSGLDIAGIVQSLVAAEGQPVDARISQQEARAQAKLSAFGSLKAALADLRDKLDVMKSLDKFLSRTAVSGDEEFFTVSAAGTDNQVFFSVGTREWQLETPNQNDFEPGSSRTYFLRDIENLKMHHITEIGLRKVGTDGWLPEEIMVWINDDELVGGPTYDAVINEFLDSGPGAGLRHGLKWVAPDYPQPTPVSTALATGPPEHA